MSELQAGRARGQAGARKIRCAHSVRLPALPGRIGASECHARCTGGRGRRRARQVLADARPVVRQPASSQGGQPARVCAAVGARHAALHRGDGRRDLSTARPRAHGRRHSQSRAWHTHVLHQRRPPRCLVRYAFVDGRRRSRTQEGRPMSFFATPAFTLLHTALSLIAIVAGLVALFGLFRNNPLNNWTLIFIVTTVATTLTGFLFPFKGFTPAIGTGIVSSLVLAPTVLARYPFNVDRKSTRL